MGTWILFFCQVEVTIIVAENDTDPASDRKIKPCNLSTTTPLVINRDMDPVDLIKRLIPAYAMKNTSKNKKESNQIADE